VRSYKKWHQTVRATGPEMWKADDDDDDDDDDNKHINNLILIFS
jgi:hypothetical protein